MTPPETPGDVCESLGLSLTTLYRALAAAAGPKVVEPIIDVPLPGEPGKGTSIIARMSPRALSQEEQGIVLDTMNSDRFIDRAPPQVYTALLDEGVYIGSISTIYRLLRGQNEVRERRNQLTHPVYAPPELMARRPNEAWSWDITKLRGPFKGIYHYLYVILDLFSRYVVGWTLQYCESQEIARDLIEQTCNKQKIEPDQLTLHADRGSAMTSKTLAILMADLGVTKSHSRPHVSNDNPFSEAQFKTMKYRPTYPDRFGSIEDAGRFCKDFFLWYNTEHYHSGIAMVTPEDMHYGRAQRVIDGRAIVLAAAHAAHPERFVGKRPVPQPLPNEVWINPPLQTGITVSADRLVIRVT